MPFSGSGDLVGGGYPLSYSFAKGLGALGGVGVNATQSNIAPRSNAEPGFVFPGIGTPQDSTSALTGGAMTLVAVPVQYGDVYTLVDVFVGGTAASTPTHSWAALYSGVLTTTKLVGTQSTDGTTTAMAASTKFTFTLGAAYIANPTDSPYGYLYVGVSNTGTAVPSLISGNVATAAQYAYYTDSPLFYAGHIGSSLGASAPASETLGSVTVQAVVPLVNLR